jgi:hypothetical protein
VSLKFNAPWTVADWQSKVTKLSLADEAEFQKWAAANPKAVEGELDPATADYDVRGHWLAAKNHDPAANLVMNRWDGKMHGNDKFKLPSNGTFSNESMYATPDAPRWQGDKLVTKDGRVVTDETPKKTGKMTKAPSAPGAGRGAMTAPPAGGQPTLVDANRTERVQNEETTRYQRATDAYQKQLNTIRAKADFTTEKGKAQYKLDSSDAQNAYEKAKAQIVLWKAGQIKAIGGDPWKQKAKDSLGNPIGTMDGENWVNTKTGMGVPAPTGGTGGKTGAVTAPPAQGGQAQQGGTEADQPLNPYGDPGPGKTHYAIKCADGSIATGYLDANGLALVKGKPGVVDVRPIE